MIKKRVLVAEDDRYLAALIRQLLSDEGLIVSMAQNGQEALTQVDNLCPDLVVLDVGMPVLDGFTVLRVLKADRFHRHIPILMLTAASSEGDVRHAISNGASAYLTKPFRADQFLKRVKHLLEGGPRRFVYLDDQAA